MRKLWLVVVFCLVWAAGCRVDVEAEGAALRAADEAWSKTPPNLDEFMAYFAENATAIVPDAPVTTGRSAIRSLWSAQFSNPGFGLEWTATDAKVAARGGLGYTTGTFELRLQDSAGEEIARTGKYLTVWEKQADGQWKVVADIGAFDSPPAPTE